MANCIPATSTSTGSTTGREMIISGQYNPYNTRILPGSVLTIHMMLPHQFIAEVIPRLSTNSLLCKTIYTSRQSTIPLAAVELQLDGKFGQPCGQQGYPL